MHLKPNPQDNGVISKQFLKKLCRSDFKQYYTTASLNDVLYLHYKGFQKIDNLQQFTGLKVLYLQGNAIKKIQGLETLINLRCLYVQENLIRQISGLQTLTQLVNLNLSDNMIEKVVGLSSLTKLSTLQLKRNRIGADGIQDVLGLLQCQSISALDLSDNRIENQDILQQVLEKMQNLAVVYLQNNAFTKKISHYRKTLITKIPTLKYIDDKPVFQDQKRFAQAWARGGLQQERKQRAIYKKQKQDEQIRQHQQFREMIDRYKAQGKKKRQESQSSLSQNQTDSQNQSLETYRTPQDSKQTSERTSQKESASQKVQSESEKIQSQSEKVESQTQNQAHIDEKPIKKEETLQRQNPSSEQKKEQKSLGYLDELD